MFGDATNFTPEEMETLWWIILAILLIPGIFVLRFFVFLLLPKFILKKFVRTKQGYKKSDPLKKEKKFYDD